LRRGAAELIDQRRASKLKSGLVPRQGRRWWVWLELVLLVAVVPPLLFPGGWRTLALVVLPLIWLGNRVATGHFVRRTPFDVIVLLFLAMVLVSLYATYDMAISLPKITGVLLGISLFYGVVGFAAFSGRANLMVAGVIVIIALFVGIALIGTTWGSKIPILVRLGSVLPAVLRGLPGADNGFHPAEVGGTLTWIIFLPLASAIGFWSQPRTRRRMAASFALWALAAIMGFVLLLTQSRSAWIGVIVGAGVLLGLMGRWGRIMLAAGLILVVVVVLIVGPAKILQTDSDATSGTGSVFEPSLDGRVEIWSRAIYGIQDFSFTGMGLGTFRHIVPVLYPLFSVSPDLDIGHAHNELLQAGVDLGIPGLIAFIALQALGLWLAYRAVRSAGLPPVMHWLALGTLAGLAAHAVFGLTDAVAFGAKPGVFFWLLLALATIMWEGMHPSAVAHSSD
jgi:putative inorganic carbon (hco3(-)) transporter